MSEEHHTLDQIDKAFAYVPTILRKLIQAGVTHPNVTLYADASGRVYLGNENTVTDKQLKLAQDLLKSVRPYNFICFKCLDGEYAGHLHSVGVTFCCGLVTAAEEV